MEPRFGSDFSRVRVHSDPQSAQAINARAYTVGDHIVFNQGQYRPQSGAGIELLAHELSHTVQQSGARIGDGPLRMESSPVLEQESRSAAGRALRNQPAAVRQTGRPAVQRAEFGTYVSTVGDPKYLDAGAAFYRHWGHPNVQRIKNLEDVLTNLDTAKGPIDKFRIVSHGLGSALELGLIPEFVTSDTPLLTSNETQFTTEQRFRKELADNSPKLVNESEAVKLIKILQADAKTKAFLDTLGAASKTPDASSELGILLRALLDKYFLDNVQLDTGGSPQIPDRGILDNYNQLRISTYRKAVIAAADAAKKGDVTKAIAGLESELPAAIQRAKRTFTLTQSEADDLAKPFLDPNSKGKQLIPALKAEVTEGAGGPFLKKLRSVRKKISSKTHIEIRGCNVGSSPTFMNQLRGFFGDPGDLPSMSAPDLFQYFFQLNFETFTKNPADEKKLQDEYTDPMTGLSQGYLQSDLVRAKKVAIVVNERTLADVSKNYGVSEADLKKLNPKANATAVHSGDMLWLVAPKTKTVPAGPFADLGDFCEKNLGNKYIWPTVWGLNPQIKDPRKLKPKDMITIPESSPAFTELLSTLRAGKAEAVVRKDLNKPVVYLDDAKRAQALGDWLSKQQWDPKGQTGAQLSKLYATNFSKAAAGTFVEFLSTGFPLIEDPIFPDDPRYKSHIIQQP